MSKTEKICRVILFVVALLLFVADYYVGHYVWLIGIIVGFISIYDTDNNPYKEL